MQQGGQEAFNFSTFYCGMCDNRLRPLLTLTLYEGVQPELADSRLVLVIHHWYAAISLKP
jgi:hypothetical protein